MITPSENKCDMTEKCQPINRLTSQVTSITKEDNGQVNNGAYWMRKYMQPVSPVLINVDWEEKKKNSNDQNFLERLS